MTETTPLLLRTMLTAHVAAGAVSLVAFWIAVFSKKGGRMHLACGRAFEWAMYFVAGTALVAATLDMVAPEVLHPPHAGARLSPAIGRFGAFLGYLALVTIATVRRGVRSVKTRRDPSRLRSPAYLALAGATIAAGIAVAAVGLAADRGPDVLLLSLSPLGPSIGIAMFVQAFRREHGPRDWLYHHLGSMIGGGIAAHTAFAVFGAGRVLDIELPGAWRIVPWVLPTVVGVPAIFLWIGLDKRRSATSRAAARSQTPPPLPQ